MNGGIDKIYMKMFKGIEKKVQNKISTIGLKKMGRNYLPIGSAIIVQADESHLLISSPTMTLPENIRDKKNNILYSFISILYLASQNKDKLIGVPGLGTGVGGLSGKESIDQIELAILNYDRIMNNKNFIKTIKYRDKHNLILKDDI